MPGKTPWTLAVMSVVAVMAVLALPDVQPGDSNPGVAAPSPSAAPPAAVPACGLAIDVQEATCSGPGEAGACMSLSAAEEDSAFGAKPPRPRGFCRCGCGIRCNTSADCGGSPCDPFVTCC